MSASHDRGQSSPLSERAGLLFPDHHHQVSNRSQQQQQGQQQQQHHLGRTRTRSRSPARPITHIPRPYSLLLVAFLDLSITILFTFILDLHPPDSYNRTTSDHGRPNSTIRLLTLGYVRSSCTLGLASRRNWTNRGRLGVLLGFVVTGLEVLWEINMSLLYRGWDRGPRNEKAREGDQIVLQLSAEGSEGQKRLIFLLLQVVFASMEYVTYALSIHYAARPARRSSNQLTHPELVGGRRRATSVRFNEYERREEGPDVFDSRPSPSTQHTRDDRVEQDLRESPSDDDDESNSEISTGSEVTEDDLERSSGSSDEDEDEDEIIDLPLPEEAKIERKTSIMSLRSRHRAASHPQAIAAGIVGDEEQCVGTSHIQRPGVEEEQVDGGSFGAWGSIRGALGWSKKSEKMKRRDGYGTI